MQRIHMNLCMLIAVLAICGLSMSTTTAEPQQQAAAKAGRFSTITIDQQPGDASALDIHLAGKGKAVRFFSWEPNQRGPRTYFNDAGMLYTQGWVTISGTMKGDGEDYRIEPPSLDPSMLSVWSDVIGPAIEIRTANTDDVGSYILQGLDRNANYTFSIEQNGGLRWGAATRAHMDTNLYRAAPRTLKTDGSLVVANCAAIGTRGPASTLHVGGSQSVQRTAVAADYTVTDIDYYMAITDTSARRTVTLPKASGRTGRVYTVKDESGGAGRCPISVKAQPGETVDGGGSLLIGTNYGVVRVISSGKGWFSM
jgi:hypothetical protein